jgi:hypothetical protein
MHIYRHKYMPGSGGSLCTWVAGTKDGPQTCGQAADAERHQQQTNVPPTCPDVVVEAYVGRVPHQPYSGLHHATVAWKREDDGAWWSAWTRPHNRPSGWQRLPILDAWWSHEVTAVVSRLMNSNYGETELITMGYPFSLRHPRVPA